MERRLLTRSGTVRAAGGRALSGAVVADAGIEAVLTGVQMPRMNAITERRVHTCRRELPDRTLTWNQHHLLPVRIQLLPWPQGL